MRKLLILTVVLGMASLATASVVVSGPTEVLAGGTYSYSVTGTSADTSSSYLGYVWVDYPTYSGMVSSPGQNTDNLTGPFSGYTTGYLPDGFYFIAATTPGLTEVFAGEWFTFDVTIPTDAASSTTFGIDILDGSFGVVQDAALSIHVIPEPMTMALLGLGGLFLRRRK